MLTKQKGWNSPCIQSKDLYLHWRGTLSGNHAIGLPNEYIPEQIGYMLRGNLQLIYRVFLTALQPVFERHRCQCWPNIEGVTFPALTKPSPQAVSPPHLALKHFVSCNTETEKVFPLSASIYGYCFASFRHNTVPGLFRFRGCRLQWAKSVLMWLLRFPGRM